MPDREVDVYVCVQICVMLSSRSVISDCAVIPWTVARQAPLSMGLSRQEYCSGLPFPSPGDLPDPGIEPASPASQADSFPLSHWRSQICIYRHRNTYTYAHSYTHEYYMHTSIIFTCVSVDMDSNTNSRPFLLFRFSASQTHAPGVVARSLLLFMSCEFLFADAVPVSSLDADRHKMPPSQLSTSSIITGCPVLLIPGPRVDATFRTREGALWPHPQAEPGPSDQLILGQSCMPNVGHTAPTGTPACMALCQHAHIYY